MRTMQVRILSCQPDGGHLIFSLSEIKFEGPNMFFSKVGELIAWVWNLDSDKVGEYFMGSLLMFIAIFFGLLGLAGLILLFWVTFNVSWMFCFGWPPAIALTAFLEIRIAKGIVELHDDFF